ncbi:MAG: phosphohistidine phosphatase SixA [Alphaproteobacteria bacterium]
MYLMRHGDAVTSDVDPARPLSEAGRQEVRRLAEFLDAAGMRVRRVVHSGKLRAEQTAELVAAAVAPGIPLETDARLGPNDPVEPWAREASVWDQDTLIVGHLPFMGRLAGRLLTGREGPGIATFQSAGIACLERGAGGQWSLAWMLGPELLP